MRIVPVGLLALTAGALLWIGNEQRYQSCVLKHVAAGRAITAGDLPKRSDRLGVRWGDEAERDWTLNATDVRGCKHWPF